MIATVSSPMKAEQARLAGADLVINYRTEDVVAKMMAFTEQRGVDRVVDVDFGGNIATTLKLMAINSTIAVYATNGNRDPMIPMRELMEKMHRVARAGAVRVAAAVACRGPGRYLEMARRPARASTTSPRSFRSPRRRKRTSRSKKATSSAPSSSTARADHDTGVVRSSVQVSPNASSPSAR